LDGLSFNELISKIDSFVWGPYFLVPILLGAGLFMSIRLRFIQFRGLPHGLALVTGRYDDEKDPGEITHFQALSAA
jgi:AGCS family alanine or glycine:cation symporter